MALTINRTARSADTHLNGLQSLLKSKQGTFLDKSNSVVGCESLGDDQFDALDAAHNTIAANITTSISGIGNESADAMAEALMICSDGEKLQSAMKTHLGAEVGNEAFDSNSVINNLHLTVGVAGELAVQVTDANFIFPKVVVDQKTTNYKLTALRTVIEPKFYHAADGAVTDWGKLNLLNASVVDNMLRKDLNVFIPELTAGRADNFVSDELVTPWEVERTDGAKVTTSYLGTATKALNLISISTAKGMDRNTENTILDRIDEGAKIKGIILTVGQDAGTAKAIYVNTASANHSTFTKSETEGDANKRQVTFNDTTFMVNLVDYVKPEVGGFANIEDIAALKALVDAGYTKVGFRVSNTYTLDLSSGTFKATAATPEVVYVEGTQAKGVNVLSQVDEALVEAIAPQFAGTDIAATLSNATLKMAGDQLGNQTLDKFYSLDVKTPIEIRKGVLDDVDDTTAIKMISQALMFRRDDETVADLHNWFAWAKANLGHEGAPDVYREDLDIIMLHYLLKPYVKEVDIKLEELLKEEDTTSKFEVLEVGLVSQMQDELVQMFQETNYRSVVRTHGSDPKFVPQVNLFGDSRITNYIMRTGEDRTFGDGVSMAEKPHIHATDRTSMRNTIYAFPRAKSYESQQDRIFGFGHAIEILPIVVKRARDNGQAMDQVQVWPVYKNIVTTPMMIKFNVSGLTEYFARATADVVAQA